MEILVGLVVLAIIGFIVVTAVGGGIGLWMGAKEVDKRSANQQPSSDQASSQPGNRP